jgi:hypothetical protein
MECKLNKDKKPEAEIFISNVDSLGSPIGEWHKIKVDKNKEVNKKKFEHVLNFKITEK